MKHYVCPHCLAPEVEQVTNATGAIPLTHHLCRNCRSVWFFEDEPGFEEVAATEPWWLVMIKGPVFGEEGKVGGNA